MISLTAVSIGFAQQYREWAQIFYEQLRVVVDVNENVNRAFVFLSYYDNRNTARIILALNKQPVEYKIQL